MYTLLNSILLADSAAAVRPVAVREEGPNCGNPTGQMGSLTVSDFALDYSYVFNSPTFYNGSGNIKFNFTNPTVSYSTVCAATSTKLDDFFHSGDIYNCQVPNDKDKVIFSYDKSTGVLDITHYWYCPGGTGGIDGTGVEWIGEGSTVLNAYCSEEKYKNPDWHMGETYASDKFTCGPVDAIVPVTSLVGVA